MMIAKGTITWILTPFAFGIIFLAFYINYQKNIGDFFLLVSVLMFILTGFFIIFFRDPIRDIGKGIVAPADGRIQYINHSLDRNIGECAIISTFMNLHNVHVNRMPLDGLIKDVVHIFGSHLPAFKKDSARNERVIITIDTDIGLVKLIQISGTLARRIVPYIKKGDKLKKGEKIGIILFGSRVDIYIPSKKIEYINVKLGDKIRAGEKSIAKIND
jgi:phosphatidylserine decarboxylase